MLHKVLNPEGRGGIKSPTINKLEDIAAALEVSPAWLAFGEGAGKPQISAATLRDMAEYAAGEIQPGLSISQIRSTVESALREQLALRLLVVEDPSGPDAGIAPGTAAQSPAPTIEGEQEGSRSS